MKKIRLMSREQIQERLKELESRKAPQPKMGACCYSMSTPPKYAEYICPACGEKTLYTDDHAEFVVAGLESCRREFVTLKKVSEFTTSLDESTYCGKCSPDASTFQLSLTLTYKDGTSVKTAPVADDDLRLLNGFFQGKSSYKTSTDGSRPLKKELARLTELLFGSNSESVNVFINPPLPLTGGRTLPEDVDAFTNRDLTWLRTTFMKLWVDTFRNMFEKEILEKIYHTIRKRDSDNEMCLPEALDESQPCYAFGIFNYVLTEHADEFGLILSEQDRKTLQYISDTIERIDTHDYGICQMCNEDIPSQRLKALPLTKYCAKCKSDLEKLQAHTTDTAEIEKYVRDRFIQSISGYSKNDK